MDSDDEQKLIIKEELGEDNDENGDSEEEDSGEENEEGSGDESDIQEQQIYIDYDQDDAVLGDESGLPSTSTKSNILSMRKLKELNKKPRKKKRRRKTKTGGKVRKKSTKRRKKRRTKRRKGTNAIQRGTGDLAKQLRLRWAKKARELTTRERIIETCGIDTKQTNRYKIVVKSKSNTTLRSAATVFPEKLDILGSSVSYGLKQSIDEEDMLTQNDTVDTLNLESQKEEKLVEPEPTPVDLLDKILEDQSKTFTTPSKKVTKTEQKPTIEPRKPVEREILSRHERRKRLREEFKKNAPLDRRLKNLMEKTDETASKKFSQAFESQQDERSEMETMPMTSRADFNFPDPLSKPPRKTRWQRENAPSAQPPRNMNFFNGPDIVRNDPKPPPSQPSPFPPGPSNALLPGLLGSIPTSLHQPLQLPTSTNALNPNLTQLASTSNNAVLDLLRNASILPTSMNQINLLTAQLNAPPPSQPQNPPTDLLALYRQQLQTQAQINPLLLQAQLLQQQPLQALQLPSLQLLPQQLAPPPPAPTMHLPPPPPPPLTGNMFNQRMANEGVRIPDASLPHIPLPSSSPGGNDAFLPRSESRSSGSPMDIEMEIGDDSYKPTTSRHGQDANVKDSGKKYKDSRLNDAVSAMKTALKPYYRNKIISKHDYKEIMKKGVDKLVHTKNDSLDQKRVDKFAKKYVDLVVYNRKKEKHEANKQQQQQPPPNPFPS